MTRSNIMATLRISASVIGLVGLAAAAAQIGETESDIIVPPVQRSAFGGAVAIDGNTLVVGAKSDDEVADNAGAAYVFMHDGSDWVVQQKLTAADGEPGDAFGLAVDVSGDFIVAGAPGAVGASGAAGGGAAYIFKRDGGTWIQDARLVGSLTVSTDSFDTPGFDRFGRSVAINGDVPAESTDGGIVHNVVVGAPGDNHSTHTDAGSAFMFQLSADGTAWNATAKLVASDPTADSEFGATLDLDGDHMIIGAPKNGSRAYIFIRRGSQGAWGLETSVGELVGGLESGAVAVFARSGRAIFAIGTPGDSDLGSSSGAVHVLEGSTQPFDRQKIFTSGQDEFDRFGSDVAVLSGRVLASAITAADNVGTSTGAAYLFEDVSGSWTQTRRFFGTGASRMETVAAAGDLAFVGNQSYPGGLLDGIVYIFDGLDVLFGSSFESP